LYKDLDLTSYFNSTSFTELYNWSRGCSYCKNIKSYDCLWTI
jgi:hypothetical protein